MNTKQRSAVALLICAASAILGAYLATHGKSRGWTALDVGCVWLVTADWLGRRLWLLGLSLGKVHAEAKRGGLRLTGLARTMWWGGAALIVAGLCTAVASRA